MRLGTDGGSEISPLEQEVLLAMFTGDPEQIEILRSQLDSSSVLSRHYSGVGFVTKFRISRETEALNSALRRIEGHHPGLPEAVEFVLTLKNGQLDTLEAYAFGGMWPEQEAGFRFE